MQSLIAHSDKVRQQGRRWRKIRNIVFLILLFGFIVWGGITYYYPYTTGIKTGKLNYIVYKGLVFKTYEGKLIQTDVVISNEGDIRSNEFEFSIAKKSIAEKLIHAGGKTVELHYTEYFKPIPWRGNSRYIVDDIVNISDDREEYMLHDVI